MKTFSILDLLFNLLRLLCLVGIGIYVFIAFHQEKVNCADLNTLFSQFDKNVIFDYVCKSRYWVVYSHEDYIYAILNSQLLLSNSCECASTIGAVFFFSNQNVEMPCDVISRESVTGDHFKVSVFREKGYWQSAIRLVFDSRTSMQIDEFGLKRKRAGTQAVFNYLQHVVLSPDINQMLVEEHSALNSGGTNEVAISANGVLDLATRPGKITGWINCREPGSVGVSVRDAKYGEILFRNDRFGKSMLVGWDIDAMQKFFFETDEILVCGDGNLTEVEIEITFSPLDGKPMRTVYATKCLLKTCKR